MASAANNLSRLALAALLYSMAGSLPAMAQAQDIAGDAVVVDLDHARVVRLPEKLQTLIVGNPSIADVTVQKNGIMIVTGKSYGVTNLIALDATGNILVDTTIRVQAAKETLVTVHRGLERESYSCAPACQPTVKLGDAQRYFSEAIGQSTARNSAAGRPQGN